MILEGSEAIERRLGGRDAGTSAGHLGLDPGDVMAGEARYEAGLVFPLCGRTALLDISALTPSGDSAGGAMGFGEYMIMGTKPTLWNRDQVLATIRGISVEGSLPASRLVARSAGRGSAAPLETAPARRPPASRAARAQKRPPLGAGCRREDHYGRFVLAAGTRCRHLPGQRRRDAQQPGVSAVGRAPPLSGPPCNRFAFARRGGCGGLRGKWSRTTLSSLDAANVLLATPW